MRLLTGLNSISCFLRDREARGEGERGGNGQLVKQSEHRHLSSAPFYMHVIYGALKQLQQ